MSGPLTDAARTSIEARIEHKTATAALFNASTEEDRLLAQDVAARAARKVVDAKATYDAAKPHTADMRPLEDARATARAGFEGDPQAGPLSRRYGIPAALMRVSVDDGAHLKTRHERGSIDAMEEGMRRVRGGLGENADKLLSSAKALVARDPELKAWLTRTGAINSAWMVRHLGEVALRRGIVR